MFLEYGDDSVAQLGGVHLACEQASNLLTKVLEWGRLMAYLEQSTRYIPYDRRLGGRYRYYRDRAMLARVARSRGATSPTWTRSSTPTPACCRSCSTGRASATRRNRATPTSSTSRRSRRRRATRSRGMLPAATLSNVGIYGTGQAFEALLLRMRAHPLPEARRLRGDDARGAAQGRSRRSSPGSTGPTAAVAWSAYLAETRQRHRASWSHRIFADERPEPRPAVTLTDFDPDGEDKVLAAICYPHTHLPDDQILAEVRTLGDDERVALLARVRGGARQPPPQARPRVRARRLPLRRARRLRRVPRPAASPHAHHRVAAALARCTATTFPKRSTKPGCARPFDDAMDAFGRAVRRAASIRSRSRRRTRCRSRTGCGSRCR